MQEKNGLVLTIQSLIDEKTIDAFLSSFSKIPPMSTLEMHIRTQGGNIGQALKVVDRISNSDVRCIGIGREFVFSAGIFLLEACDERIATPRTKFRVHRVVCENGLRSSEHDEVERFAFAYLAQRTGRDVDWVYQLADKDQTFDARAALSYGFINEISTKY